MIEIEKITIEKIKLSRDTVLLIAAIVYLFLSPGKVGEQPQMPKDDKLPAVVIENVKELPIRKNQQADTRRRK